MKFKKIKMTDEEIEEAKDNLIHCEIQKEESDLNVSEMEESLKKKIPLKLLEDDIKEAKKQIKEKSVINQNNIKIDLTEADILRLEISLKKMQKMLKLDLPMKKLRLKLNILKKAKKKIDAPEQQISKYKKNIRDKSFYVPETKNKAPGVN